MASNTVDGLIGGMRRLMRKCTAEPAVPYRQNRPAGFLKIGVGVLDAVEKIRRIAPRYQPDFILFMRGFVLDGFDRPDRFVDGGIAQPQRASVVRPAYRLGKNIAEFIAADVFTPDGEAMHKLPADRTDDRLRNLADWPRP